MARLTVVRAVSTLVITSLTACAYLHYASVQTSYKHQQAVDPRQHTYKHLIDSPNYFVFGKITGQRSVNAEALAVVAVSDRFRPLEVVDVTNLVQVGAYYGLNLPPARYRLLVLSDLDRDGYYDGSDVIASQELSLTAAEASDRVIGEIDISLDAPVDSPAIELHIPVPHRPPLAQSAVYPSGTIRTLDDEIFAPNLAELGLYEPATFLERAPMMFYALEDDFAYKVPVVFVHGITGTPRDFTNLIKRLDRRLYRPWFFYYPSGTNLAQLSEFFYRIFLSGRVVNLLQRMPMVIVAHSMGGLVVRDALNRYDRAQGGPHSIYLVTMASPFGGVPSAAAAGSAPITAPSWLDLAPHSVFLSHLHRSSLRGVEFDLIYTRGRPTANGTAPDNDGVVPLASQLDPGSRREAAHIFGYDLNHTEVLSDEGVIAQLLEKVASVRPPFSEAQLAQLTRGGFAVSHPERYTPMERHIIESEGYFLEALANSTLQPSDAAEAHFVEVLQKGLEPRNEAESAWLKLKDENDRAPAASRFPQPPF